MILLRPFYVRKFNGILKTTITYSFWKKKEQRIFYKHDDIRMINLNFLVNLKKFDDHKLYSVFANK